MLDLLAGGEGHAGYHVLSGSRVVEEKQGAERDGAATHIVYLKGTHFFGLPFRSYGVKPKTSGKLVSCVGSWSLGGVQGVGFFSPRVNRVSGLMV